MSRVFIHSWHGDFARTEIADDVRSLEARKRERAPLKLFECGCGVAHLHRMPRPFWIRVVLSFRLYRCERCGADVFRRRRGRQGYPAI